MADYDLLIKNGTIIDGQLRYAEPGHPEYRRYPVVDFLVAHAEPAGSHSGASLESTEV